jgi:hypothetical protein
MKCCSYRTGVGSQAYFSTTGILFSVPMSLSEIMKSSFILSEMWSGLTDFGMTPETESCLLIHNLHYSRMLDSRTVNTDFTAI